MPKHDSDNKDHFDLLPFIAIMMCVLGCLLLVTISMSAISIGSEATEGWIPHIKKQVPILIEWDGKEAILHESNGEKKILVWSKPTGFFDQKTNWKESSEAKTPEQKVFIEFLEKFRNMMDSHYVLFAVRPSGFKNFQQFADEFRARKINIGYEPLQQGKKVRLILPKEE